MIIFPASRSILSFGMLNHLQACTLCLYDAGYALCVPVSIRILFKCNPRSKDFKTSPDATVLCRGLQSEMMLPCQQYKENHIRNCTSSVQVMGKVHVAMCRGWHSLLCLCKTCPLEPQASCEQGAVQVQREHACAKSDLQSRTARVCVLAFACSVARHHGPKPGHPQCIAIANLPAGSSCCTLYATTNCMAPGCWPGWPCYSAL